MNRDLGQFFTSESVSRLLASSLVGVKPTMAVDVGAGSGALLKAVQQRWGNARLLGIDIDRTLRHEPIEQCVRMFGDGLDHTLPNYLQRTYGCIDLAVSNPPYTAIARSEGTDIILEEAGLLDVVRRSTKYPAELIFLAQNLRILQKDGALAIIMPSGIVNGDRWCALRRALCAQNRLKMVIELPDKAFEQTEAKTFVLIMKKSGRTRQVALKRASLEGKLTATQQISVDQAIQRMDWSYYKWLKDSGDTGKRSFCLRELGAEIFRGKFSAAEARRNRLPIFHTSDMDNCIASVYFKEDVQRAPHKLVQKGDILIARVGSRCLGRLALVEQGSSLISDCIYAIRVPPKMQSHVWKALSSPRSIHSVQTLSRGVCAKYITKDQLLDVPLFK